MWKVAAWREGMAAASADLDRRVSRGAQKAKQVRGIQAFY